MIWVLVVSLNVVEIKQWFDLLFSWTVDRHSAALLIEASFGCRTSGDVQTVSDGGQTGHDNPPSIVYVWLRSESWPVADFNRRLIFRPEWNPRSGPCSLVEVWSMMCMSFRVSLGHFSKWVLQLTKISTYKTLCPYHGTYTNKKRIFTFCLSGSPGACYRGKSCWWMTDIGFCLKYEGLQWLGGLQWLDACFFTYYLITVSYWDITPIYPSVLYNCTVLYSTDLLSVLPACMYRECTIILPYVPVWPMVDVP